jgi:hypothetical protein
MRRREFIALLGVAVAWPQAACPQRERVWQIGILHVVPPDASMGYAAFRGRLGAKVIVTGDATTNCSRQSWHEKHPDHRGGPDRGSSDGRVRV